jgi:hypothetical protein
MDPKAGLDSVEERNISALPETKYGRPTYTKSLSRLSYAMQ